RVAQLPATGSRTYRREVEGQRAVGAGCGHHRVPHSVPTRDLRGYPAWHGMGPSGHWTVPTRGGHTQFLVGTHLHLVLRCRAALAACQRLRAVLRRSGALGAQLTVTG